MTCILTVAMWMAIFVNMGFAYWYQKRIVEMGRTIKEALETMKIYGQAYDRLKQKYPKEFE